MSESPPPFPPRAPRSRERSTLDQIREDAAAAARRTKRIEEAIGELATRVSESLGSDPPPPRSRTRAELSWADDSVRIDLPNLPRAIDNALDNRDLKDMRKRRDWVMGLMQIGGGGVVSVLLWEVVRFLWRLAHQ
jgi:hypothetical protein